jgi:hypothetical protein
LETTFSLRSTLPRTAWIAQRRTGGRFQVLLDGGLSTWWPSLTDGEEFVARFDEPDFTGPPLLEVLRRMHREPEEEHTCLDVAAEQIVRAFNSAMAHAAGATSTMPTVSRFWRQRQAQLLTVRKNAEEVAEAMNQPIAKRFIARLAGS